MLRVFVLAITVICISSSQLLAHEGWGIVVDRNNRIYFADIPANTVWRLSPDGRIEAMLRDVHSHALILGSDGSVYGTDVKISGTTRNVWKLDMAGRRSNRSPESVLDLQPFLVGNDGSIFSVSRYQSQSLPEERSLHVIRRDAAGQLDTLAGGKVGLADGNGAQAQVISIDGMAWMPDGRIAFVDGARVRAISLAGQVQSLTGELTRPEWDQDLMGLSVTRNGDILVADFARRRVLKLVNGRATAIFSSALLWSPSGVTHAPNGIYILEHLRAPYGILGDLRIGPYIQVRLIAHDGRSSVVTRRWGSNSLVALAILGTLVSIPIAVSVRRKTRRRIGS